jgi:MoxR-like ATPase
VIVGQDVLIHNLLVTLFGGGNALMEGVPGLGKTMLIRLLSQVLTCSFNRIQFTPDLMPSDITGTVILSEAPDGRRGFRFERGPVFANLVLADEINRAAPRTQSALLEAMQEGMVTVAGESYPLPKPFFVLATQNPIELEGTYPLPEAQLDRFFYKLIVPSPEEDELVEIARRTTSDSLPAMREIVDTHILMEMQKMVLTVPVELSPAELVVEILGHEKKERRVNLAGARVVVAGGAGVGSAEAFALIQELADTLGGVVGATRAAVDAGWIDRDHQIGQTGVTVRPKLYIAAGISGSVQHSAGMSDSARILAINTDPEAPIFSLAHYGIVGDLREVIPKLIRAYRAEGA